MKARTSNTKGPQTSDKKGTRESLYLKDKEKRGSSVIQEQALQRLKVSVMNLTKHRDELIQKYIQLLSDPEPEKPIETKITLTDKTNDRMCHFLDLNLIFSGWIVAASRGPSSTDSEDIRLQLVVTRIKPGASEAAESEDEPPVQKPPLSRDNTPSRKSF